MSDIFKPADLEGRTFYIARHGQSTANAKHVFAGNTDEVTLEDGTTLQVELTEQGHNDAKALGGVIAAMDKKPEVIIRSGLRRNEQTVDDALGEFPDGIKKPVVVVNSLLNERNWGDLSGTSGDVYNNPHHPDRENPPKGETEEEFANRSNRALNDAITAQQGVPLVVGHLGTLKSLFTAYGVRPVYTTEDKKPPNGVLFKFTPTNQRISDNVFPWDVTQIGLQNGQLTETSLTVQKIQALGC